MLPLSTITIKGPTIALIVNEHSGSGSRHKTLYKALQGYLNVINVYGFDRKKPIQDVVKKAYHDGCKTMVAAGGDGTVSAVANTILHQQLDAKLAVLPLGTLNHFARDIGMPKTIEDCFETIVKGKTTLIDVGKMNDKYFLNNSSLGIYPFLVKERDIVKRRGFGKWIRLMIATYTTLKRHPFVTVEFKKGKKKFVRKTPFVFIGNNSYSFDLGKLGTRSKLDDGKLTMSIAHTVSRFGLIRLAWHALRGRLKEQRDFDSIGLTGLKITSRRKKIRVSYDGEVFKMKTPIRYAIAPKALHVIIP